MSRSRKKTPILGMTTAGSEKSDKQEANRKFRRRIKQEVADSQDVLSEKREVSDVWDFAKDGKQYMNSLAAKNLRK